MMFKIRISHTTHQSLASNINLTRQLYLDPPNIKFVLDYSYMYGGIKEAGVKQLVTWDVSTIITGAQLVMIVDDVIYEVTKTKYLKECVPKTDTKHQTIRNKKILTKQGLVTFNIPPPPTKPPPKLPTDQRIIQHVKKKGDRRGQIECREGFNCWRNKQGICRYGHTTTIETEV